MSDLPPPNPLPYYTPYQAPPSRRPLSVSIIGWIAAIFGGLGTLSGPCLLIQRQFLSGFQPNDPINSAINSPGPIATFMAVAQIFGWCVNVLILIAGIGLLNLKYWARKLMIGIMIFQLFSLVVGIFFNFALVMPAFAKIAAQHPNDLTVQMTYRIMIVAQIFGLLIGAAYPPVIIFFLTRPRAKAAFESPQPQPPAI